MAQRRHKVVARLGQEGGERHAAGIQAFDSDTFGQNDCMLRQEEVMIADLADGLCPTRAPVQPRQMPRPHQRGTLPKPDPHRMLGRQKQIAQRAMAAGVNAHWAQGGPRRDFSSRDLARADPQQGSRSAPRKADKVTRLQALNPAEA
jgi:hypothetical protein